MAINDDKRRPAALNLETRRKDSSDSTSSTSSLGKPPRTPRFAEATSIHSPIEAQGEKNVFPQSQPGDIGFGYINSNPESVTMPMSPRSPLKSALKVPGTPGRGFNPLSPTFREEQVLEKREALTDVEQAKDLKVKTRVRMAKFALRGVNFSCSLIVLAMLSSTFSIFNATKELTAKNGLPAWAANTNITPQILTLVSSCISLFLCILVFIGYTRGGHKRAEKVGVYYTLFACGWFIFSMAIWVTSIIILQHAKVSSDNKDLWGWSCNNNIRHELFNNQVDYALVCRLQNWSLVCMIIEVVIEAISITLYSVVFYRYYSKRRLMKSMDMRDKARSDLYLAQLRTQSAPNTPGFGPKSPSFSSVYGPKSPGGYSQQALSPRFPPTAYRSLGDIEETGASPFTPGGKHIPEPQSSFASMATARGAAAPFKLQAPPSKAPSATRKPGLSPVEASPIERFSPLQRPQQQPEVPSITVNEHGHGPVAAEEPVYDAVPIPGAYAGQAIKSPPPAQTSFHGR
ncbi:hypothetical protein M406DRAFT_355095 [Cryphonectria parasitica EP155]|uniref:Hyphal anastamosis-8 protein n=1 Tax=Cryphonectria parasitica (strain ATCC 38755 / EP155) TaxID=660469 RepID=A0A9P5CT19_CRYP1|nr:uncharacterized protein M406DRAFT_355095 [Cryphonectria parasitica EP155]KAF3768951.1 hypothetical protein M406DRAFT_355095 [Cryphonectria parasitica EP155]